jgi:hypothetical protein
MSRGLNGVGVRGWDGPRYLIGEGAGGAAEHVICHVPQPACYYPQAYSREDVCVVSCMCAVT